MAAFGEHVDAEDQRARFWNVEVSSLFDLLSLVVFLISFLIALRSHLALHVSQPFQTIHTGRL